MENVPGLSNVFLISLSSLFFWVTHTVGLLPSMSLQSLGPNLHASHQRPPCSCKPLLDYLPRCSFSSQANRKLLMPPGTSSFKGTPHSSALAPFRTLFFLLCQWSLTLALDQNHLVRCLKDTDFLVHFMLTE